MASRNTSPETRQSLILRLRDKENAVAWEEFVEIYLPLIRSLALNKGLQVSDAEDIAQDVLTSVTRHIAKWKPTKERASFRRWLATITRNQSLMFFRKNKRVPWTGMDSHIETIAIDSVQAEYDKEHDRQMFAWAAREVQSRFETKTWQAFWMTAVEETSVAEVSKKLGISEGQVYVARSRVMTRLKEKILRAEFDPIQDAGPNQ